MAGKLEAQCWICPKCHDDHSQDGPCSPPSGPFMPAPEDQSYIAEEYRKLAAENKILREGLERIHFARDEVTSDEALRLCNMAYETFAELD